VASSQLPARRWRIAGEVVRGPLTHSVKPQNAVGWFLPLLAMLGRCMEDAQAMSRAVRWGDAAHIEDMTDEDMTERGCKIRRSLIGVKQA
jgi:hypothetical protein